MIPTATPTPTPIAVPIGTYPDWPWEGEDVAEPDACVGELVGAPAAGDAEPAEVGAAHSRCQQSVQPALVYHESGRVEQNPRLETGWIF